MNNTTEGNNQYDHDFWGELRRFTDARIALGHTGVSLPTDECLRFTHAHAQARDAVHLPLDKELMKKELAEIGVDVVEVHSDAKDRQTFLKRPDLGRRLNSASRSKLQKLAAEAPDVVFVIGDGLSSKAVHRQAVPLLKETLPYLDQLNLSVAPIILAEQSRVALGDEIAQILNAKLVAMLIGERPGLSSPDSLGIYLTYNPCVGRLDSERNCISNVRPEGLTHEKAAFKMAWLIQSAFSLRQTGIALKDESDLGLLMG